MSMTPPRPPRAAPLLPDGVDVLVAPPPYEACTLADKLLVYASSLIVVGSPLWFYGGILYLYRRWRRYRALASSHSKGGRDVGGDDPAVPTESYTSSGESSQERPDGSHWRAQYGKLALKYGAALAVMLVVSVWGPHRSRRLGERLGARNWRLWDAWLNYVGFTVLRDRGASGAASLPPPDGRQFDVRTSPAIFAFVPHGIFPFGLAFSCLPRRGYEGTWGPFRPVVATATQLFPLVRTFIAWMGGVDASKAAVSSALRSGAGPRRLGISPGGIAEMFETYPKPGFHPDDEAALLRHRTGIFKLALEHDVPIVPVYCFGATKMFRRVQLPHFVETLSRALKLSLCLLFGELGLPIAFRQRMMYVVGNTIWPLAAAHGGGGDGAGGAASGAEFERRVRDMHDAFCGEVTRIFDRNKAYYGWENKTLRLV